MKTNDRDSYVAMLDDEATTGNGLVLAGWGFATVVACVLGFASWQYATPRVATTEVARAETSLPDPIEVTGSIAPTDRATIQAARVVGAAKVAPQPLASNETLATSRDIDQLRAEIKDLQRRINQMGLSGDGMSRRVDRLEEKLVGDPAAARDRLAALPPVPSTEPTTAMRTVEAPRPAEPALVAARATETRVEPPVKTAEADPRLADHIPLPTPRPLLDGPTVTGSIPPRAAEAPADMAKIEPGKPGRGVATTPIAVVPPEVPKPGEPAKDEAAIARPAPAAPSPPPGDAAALDLGGYRTLASLRRSWSDMTSRYSEFGGKMEPLARLRETDSGMEARLLAGPYPSQTEAAKSCMRLKALGVTCSVTGYSGQPLAGVK